MRNLRKKNLVLVLLVLFALAVSGTTYAYWASSVTGSNDTAVGTINIGSGNTVSTTVTVGDANGGTDLLVPEGHDVDTNEVDYVMLQFTVAWDSTGLDASGYASTLSFGSSNIQIGGTTTGYEDLVNISYQIGGTVTGSTLNGDGSTAIIADGADVTVFVLVTLTEPADQTAYNAVAGQVITFTGTFTVA
jgi:predicted ribosomally synthesized peptide with SipW-like signal peptide